MNTLKEVKQAHSEYDKFTGRLVHRFETTHYDPKTKLFYKRTTEYIDIGRPDPVTPASGEGDLKPEKLWREPVDNAAAMRAVAEKAAKYQAETEALLVEHLKRNGPCSLVELILAVNRGRETIRKHLHDRKNTVYCQIGTSQCKHKWGLRGVHDKAAA